MVSSFDRNARRDRVQAFLGLRNGKGLGFRVDPALWVFILSVEID